MTEAFPGKLPSISAMKPVAATRGNTKHCVRPPQNYYLFRISHLVGKSSFKCRTEYFLSYVTGGMFRANELFVDSVDLAFVYLFLGPVYMEKSCPG